MTDKKWFRSYDVAPPRNRPIWVITDIDGVHFPQLFRVNISSEGKCFIEHNYYGEIQGNRPELDIKASEGNKFKPYVIQCWRDA